MKIKYDHSCVLGLAVITLGVTVRRVIDVHKFENKCIIDTLIPDIAGKTDAIIHFTHRKMQ